MRPINDYSEYLKALKDKSSQDPSVRNEANCALDVLQREDPDRFNLYRALNGEIKASESSTSKKVNKEQFIIEHPGLSVVELRNKARARLLRGPYGLGWQYNIPTWISEEDMLKSIDRLTLKDLITARGHLVQRETLVRRCINLAVAERRIDEKKLRTIVHGQFCNYFRNGTITLQYPYLSTPVKRMLMEEATVEELAFVNDGWSVNVHKLVRLINSKQIKATKEEILKFEKRAKRKERKKAKKEEALKKTTDEKKE